MYKVLHQKLWSPPRTLAKLLLIMKLTTLILITAILQVSATTFAQKISLSVKDAPLTVVMDQIRIQTGYDFLYESVNLKNLKKVSIDAKNEELNEVLTRILKPQSLVFEIDDNSILIKSKPAERNVIDKVMDFYSAITIRGKVVDEDGVPLPGASVKAGTKTAITDSNGEFSLDGVNEGTTVEISYLGYKTASLIASARFMSVQLTTTPGQLNETVIKGYYNTTRELNTGNVSIVKGSDLVKNATGDPIIALQGRVPGLYISQSTGNAGAYVNVQLRGLNSLRDGANNPLYIIDGTPFNASSLTLGNAGGAATLLSPFASLDVSSIERIEVLKDADATAIYGSRGANGVILITTKRAVTGKARINANVYSGAGRVASKLELMNTAEYLEMRLKARSNDGLTAPPTNPDLNGSYGDINKYTDWQDIFLGGTAHLTDASASVSGGNAETSFMLGAGYRRETSVYPGDYFDRKAAFNANINHTSGKFKSSFILGYVNDNNQLATADFSKKILLAPNGPDLYTETGALNWQNSSWENPLWATNLRTKNQTENTNAALNLGYEWVQGLSTTVRTGYNYLRNEYAIPNPFIDYDPAVTISPTMRSTSYGHNQVRTWIIEPAINFTKNIGQSKLESLVGATLQQTDQDLLAAAAAGFSSPELVDNIAAATIHGISAFDNTRYRYNAIYARIGYTYQQRYILNLTGRRDASSRFGPGKQFANFGAIGAAWIFSKQSFIENKLSFISFGKLRLSYGLTGNDQIKDYQFLSTYTPGSSTYQDVGALNPTSLTNPEYGWETVKKLEAAIELGFLKDRILVNASWYRNRTGNQLVGYGLPGITGFTSIQANLPAVIQNSGTEFDITTQIINTGSFQWNVSGNLSIPKNRLVSYPNLASSSYASRYVVGYPLSINFFYEYTGIDPTKNVYTVKDQNNDGEFTTQEDKRPVFIGQKFFGGLSNSFSYKGLQLDIFLQFVKQNGYKFVGAVRPGAFNANFPNNLRTVLEDERNGSIQKLTSSSSSEAGRAYSLFTQSDGVLMDASFLRLKNVSLSWLIPQRYQQYLGLKNARIYFQAQNLITISKYKGFDPENAYNGGSGNGQISLPPLAMLSAGIQISL